MEPKRLTTASSAVKGICGQSFHSLGNPYLPLRPTARFSIKMIEYYKVYLHEKYIFMDNHLTYISSRGILEFLPYRQELGNLVGSSPSLRCLGLLSLWPYGPRGFKSLPRRQHKIISIDCSSLLKFFHQPENVMFFRYSFIYEINLALLLMEI
jgi:hypothetical protein